MSSGKLQIQYQFSDELPPMLEEILAKYDNKFYFVNLDDILCVEELNKRPRHIAKIRLLEQPLTLLSDKKFILEVARQNWDMLTYNQKILVLYHELLHIKFNFEFNKYELRQHDVEDFSEILSVFGLGWADEGTDVPNILDHPEIWDSSR